MALRTGFGFVSHIDQYREATFRQAKLPGVTFPTFMCRKCGKQQGVVGRRRVVKGTSRHGYHCANCLHVRQAAVTA